MNKDFNRLMVSQEEGILGLNQFYHPDKNQVVIRQEDDSIRFFPGHINAGHAAFYSRFNKSGYSYQENIIINHIEQRLHILRKDESKVVQLLKIKKHSLKFKGLRIK